MRDALADRKSRPLVRGRSARSRALAWLLVALVATWPLTGLATDTVTGTKGDFRVTVTGTTIDIEYDPKGTNTCEKIVFIQTCLTKIEGAAVKPSDEDSKWKFQDDDTAKDGKTTIDHVTCEADPYYNGDDPDKDGGQQGDATKAEANDDAKMDDTPGTSIPTGKDSIGYCFETCAYCVDDNSFLECITWTYTNDSTNGESVDHDTGATAKDPSDEIKEAKQAFDKNHTKDGSKISQEATTAASGKKFDIQAASINSNLFSNEAVPPGFIEPGTNLLEFLQNGVTETDVTLPVDVIPVGSVSGVEIVSGHFIMSVEVLIEDFQTGPPLFGQPFDMNIAIVDPEGGNPVLIDAQLQSGPGNLSFDPLGANFSTPNLQPFTSILLVYDLGPVPVPALSPDLLLLLALVLVASALLIGRRRLAASNPGRMQ